MPRGGDFDLRLDASAVEDLAADAEAEQLAQDAGDVVANKAADFAPKLSGAGAASIHAEVDVDADGAFADVSWEREQFHMGFHELGTEKMPPHPFLRPGLDATSI